jgi:hypothetical protein
MNDKKLNEKVFKVVDKLNKLKEVLKSMQDEDKLKYIEYLNSLVIQLEDFESEIVSYLEDVPLVNLKKRI